MAIDLQALILRIYDTVADEALWPEVLDELVNRVGAQGCILFEWSGDAGSKHLTTPFFSKFYTADGLSTYLGKCAHLEAQDQEVIRANTSVQDAIDLVDDTVIARSRDRLEEMEHVRTLRRFGILHRAAGVMNKDNRWLSLFSVQFSEGRGPLSDTERSDLVQLLPHLAKALDLGHPIREQRRVAGSVLAGIDQLSVGVCILDPSGSVVVSNTEFRRQLESYRAMRIRHDGRLRIEDAHASGRVEQLMADARNHGRFGGRPRKEAISIAEDDFLCLEVSPLHRIDDLAGRIFSGFILFSADTSRPFEVDAAAIKDAFGLTDAERAIVEAMGEGLTNPQIAERRERSVETVNAQVKSVLSKSRCGTRTQFVRMLTSFGARFLANH